MSTVTTTNILNHFMGLLPRRIYPSMFAQQIVSVQPMTLPAGQLFYLDYKYGKLLEYNWKKPGLFDRITFIQIGDLIDITSDIFGTRSDEESIIITREIDVLYPSPIKIIKFVEEFGSALCTVCEKIQKINRVFIALLALVTILKYWYKKQNLNYCVVPKFFIIPSMPKHMIGLLII